MTSEVKPDRATREPARYDLRALHVFTLCGFAFTVPILTAFARQPVYIYDQQFGWTEIGGLLIGLIETFWSAYFSIDYKDVAAFSVLAITLIFLPQGLFGRPDVEKV